MAVAPFSVVIPLYNKGALAHAAVRSVLAGSVVPEQIIVVDDGSTDDSVAWLGKIEHPSLHVVSQQNRGVSVARNRGIDEAAADYIAFLDADDVWDPTHLEHLAALTKAFPEAAMFTTGYYLLGADGTRRRSRVKGINRGAKFLLIERFYEVWRHGNFFCTSSVAVSRARLNGGGLRFPAGERLGEDQDLWFRLAEQGPVAHDPRPTAGYRQDVGASLSRAPLPLEPLPYIARLAERLSSGTLPVQHRAAVTRLLAANQVARALRHLKQGRRQDAAALIFDPLSRKAGVYWWRAVLSIYLSRGSAATTNEEM